MHCCGLLTFKGFRCVHFGPAGRCITQHKLSWTIIVKTVFSNNLLSLSPKLRSNSAVRQHLGRPYCTGNSSTSISNTYVSHILSIYFILLEFKSWGTLIEHSNDLHFIQISSNIIRFIIWERAEAVPSASCSACPVRVKRSRTLWQWKACVSQAHKMPNHQCPRLS